MKKAIIAILGIVVLVAVALSLSGKEENSAIVSAGTIPLPTKPRVEVVNPTAFLLSEEGDRVREIVSGEDLDVPAQIETDENGKANIYFPDGSVARVEPSTTLTVEDGSYDEDSGTLVARIFLTSGKVWSKIIELATPESVWEIKTGSAVATVRGTAFGVSVEDGRAEIVVSENNVAVMPIDPETKNVVKEREILVSSGKELAMDARIAKELIAGKVKMTAVATSDAVAGVVKKKVDAWIEENKKRDIEMNTIIEGIRKNVEGVKDLRQEIRKEVLQRVQEVRYNMIEEGRLPGIPKIAPEIIDGRVREIIKENIIEQIKKPEANILPVIEQRIEQKVDVLVEKARSIKGIELVTASQMSKLVEGDKVSFQVFVRFEDETKKEITGLARFEVVGGVGIMINGEPGLFVAKMDPSLLEYGKANGVVVASWKNPITTEIFLDKTPIFEVSASVNPDQGMPI